MKKIKFLLSVLLGIGGTLAYQWVYPPFGNPYYFLSPKITIGEPIDIPIKLYEKGYEVDFVFWNTPLPEGRMFFITPLQSPYPRVVLQIKENENFSGEFYSSRLLYNNELIGDNALKIVFQSLPTGGVLQYFNGTSWVTITSADIGTLKLDASLLKNDNSSGLRFVSNGSEVRSTSFIVAAVDR